MQRRAFLVVSLATLAMPARAAAPSIEVYKAATCSCCALWVSHLRTNGFDTHVIDVPRPAEMRRRAGLPDAVGSCHTAFVGGYAIEGHVPAREIKRLLAERPDAIGLAVPEMPVGSPGMERRGRFEPYDVLLVGRDGKRTVFASYGK
jgi:hypothetical protein